MPQRLASRIDEIVGELGVSAALQGADEIRSSLRTYAVELCEFQSARLAEDFLDVVKRIARTDRTAGDGSSRLTASASAGLYKLMAYKDEYEVARLMADPAAHAQAREVASSVGGVVSWNLHPPVLRTLGLSRKIRIPVEWRGLFSLLARGKRLRGRCFDPFGRTAVRRTERALVGEYVAAIDAAAEALERDAGAARYEQAVAISRLAELVRGYEDIKMATVDTFRAELDERVGELAR